MTSEDEDVAREEGTREVVPGAEEAHSTGAPLIEPRSGLLIPNCARQWLETRPQCAVQYNSTGTFNLTIA
jgi:hypothetical protein